MNSIVIPTITTLEVRTIISSTKIISPGWDDIPVLIAKNPLTTIIKISIKEGVFPSELKFSKIFETLYNHTVYIRFIDWNCSLYVSVRIQTETLHPAGYHHLS